MMFAIVSMGMAIYRNYRFGLKESYMLYIIAVVSTAMFFMRYSMRKRHDKKH